MDFMEIVTDCESCRPALEEKIGRDFDSAKLVEGLEMDDSRLICEVCGEPLTYLVPFDLFICPTGHIQIEN